ncbi:MAG: hypothetical protein EHM70_00445 [Chloroflexota bacterium]|nr:MAG: hypothetical protein EHM70_00445 [Chloroflexota bacterium]
MSLQGKGFFTWKVANCEAGNTTAIASLAKAANLTHILVKIANGSATYNVDPTSGVDLAQRLVQALHAVGIQAYGWHYVYGDSPISEANIAIQRILQLGVDGYIIDAEAEYKKPGKKEAAKKFMNQLRLTLPNLPIGLSSYRYPSYHPELPWREFLEKCDFNMPQVYWMQAHNPGEQLNRCVREFQAMTPYRPIIPTGAAFREHGWQPTAAEVLEFLQTAKRLNLAGANFWEWSDARSGKLPGLWEQIRDFSWTQAPAPQDITERLIAAYNTHDPVQVANLYTPTAVHVTSARTIQGTESIRSWYNTIFNQILPNATFKLTSYSGTGPSRHFTWTAASGRGSVQNGNDTLGLVNDKIAYHYSFFTTTP